MSHSTFWACTCLARTFLVIASMQALNHGCFWSTGIADCAWAAGDSTATAPHAISRLARTRLHRDESRIASLHFTEMCDPTPPSDANAIHQATRSPSSRWPRYCATHTILGSVPGPRGFAKGRPGADRVVPRRGKAAGGARRDEACRRDAGSESNAPAGA